MFANVDPLTLVFGSLSGIAALIIAINTVLIRREANKQKTLDDDNKKRLETFETSMETFETSQSSLQAALLRADIENERLRARIEKQEIEISALKTEVASLKLKIAGVDNG